MKNNPIFTGIPGGIEPINNTQVQNLLGKAGLNTGNFLFVSALRRLLGTYDDIYKEYNDTNISHDVDYIAISAANWVSPDTDFSKLASHIESLDLPCLVVGLGAQVPFEGKVPTLTKGTKRFLDVISERSNFISVRGGHTQEVLSDYGIKNTWVTGCPSIFGYSDKIVPVKKKASTLSISKIILQGTRHGYSEHIFKDNHFNNLNLQMYRYALQNEISLLLQSEVPDIYWAMRRDNNEELNIKISKFLSTVYEKPIYEIKKYLADHGLVFWNVDTWVSEIKEYDFLIGTRIHGVISALIAGTPAVLLAHDERTKELAEVMNIPYVDSRSLDEFNYSVVEKAYNEINLDIFNEGVMKYKNNFRDFFESNNVRINKEFNND